MRAFFHGDYEDITPEDNKAIYKLMDWLKEQSEGNVAYSLTTLREQEKLELTNNQQAINGMNVLLKNHDLDEIVFTILYYRRRNRMFWGKLRNTIMYYYYCIKLSILPKKVVFEEIDKKQILMR